MSKDVSTINTYNTWENSCVESNKRRLLISSHRYGDESDNFTSLLKNNWFNSRVCCIALELKSKFHLKYLQCSHTFLLFSFAVLIHIFFFALCRYLDCSTLRSWNAGLMRFVHLVLITWIGFFLPFHPPVLKPRFYLSFIQAQGLRKLGSVGRV